MRSLMKLLKKNIDIILGVIISILACFQVEWDINNIQLIYSVTLLTIVLVWFLRFFVKKNNVVESKDNLENNIENDNKKQNKKKKKRKRKEKRILDKFIDVQTHTNAIEIAENPYQVGEQLGKSVEDTVKGGLQMVKWLKKSFKWIGKYWQQLVGLLGVILYLLAVTYFAVIDKLGFILEYVPNTRNWHIATYIGYGLLALFIAYYILRNQIKWVGWGSVEKANEYKEQIKDKANAMASGLSKETKKKFNELLQEAKKGLKTANNALSVIQVKYNNALNEFNLQVEFVETIKKNGLDSLSQEGKLLQLRNVAEQLANELNTAQNEVSNFEKQIQDYEKILAQ